MTHNNGDIKDYYDNTFNWKYIHDNIDLNQTRDNLWKYSKWFSMRYESIINMIEDGYYFEALLNLIILVENYHMSEIGNANIKYSTWINENISNEDDKKILSSLRVLRNKMAHSSLILYYVKFDNDETEYPLNETGNYRILLKRLFLFLSSQFGIFSTIKNYKAHTCMFEVKKFSLESIALQYGYNQADLDKFLNINIGDSMGLEEQNKIRKENKIKFLRLLNNSSPVCLWEELFKGFLK